MNRAQYVVFGVWAMWLASVQANFGSSYSLIFPTPYTNFFKKISITIEVPKAPDPQENFLYIWPGIDLDSSLFQPVLASFQNPSVYGCDANPGQWCLWLYVFDSLTSYKEAPKKAVSSGDLLDMVIEYKNNGQGYAQSVSRGGRIISKLDGGPGGGKARRMQTVVECANNATGLSPAHTYTNLTMVLGTADPTFAQTIRRYYDNATATELYTQDSGTSWKIDTIHMNSSDCDTSNNTPRTPSQITSSSVKPTPTANAALQRTTLTWWCCLIALISFTFSISACL